ncbi:TetR/AcrR family transcriptional regulator [Micromonospora sp. NBC_01813]|uniref:TetR/AcrR family transcriptional regulator n=1 Tax=Micromonospora sp. NBC_01813 TaxID=2975988 RepID=UPI002DD89A04|nr:TetR/AcrR family transcriptional regulator [Micromonospora sp. NBC_01813]WSA09915.1 TetR/AcrR family transcriptional regulator [Micromonospora sp. NBC_01813]
MTASRPPLRERKKQATREAIRVAALRLALERGPDNVRVDDIAEAAGVSPRTYNNYFSSREQAIVAAVTAERASQLAAAITDRPTDVGLADAVIDAVVSQYADPGDHAQGALLMITTSPALRACYVDAVTAIEEPLAQAIIRRCPNADAMTGQVLAASASAAAKVAVRQWLRSSTVPPSMPGFVVPSGSLPDLVRAALTPLGPAFDAAVATAATPQ